jgi:glyoxylase-like metal-dependent hydrolase (beta-lactamase superfamily II)
LGKDFWVTGLSSSACYLLDGERPVLFDAGYTCAGYLYEEGIRHVLMDRMPEILFLTHVHYDHCGATSYLKRAFPTLKVAGSKKAAEIMQRSNAQKLMAELNRTAFSFVSRSSGVDQPKLLDETFQPFDLDVILNDGDVVELGDTTVRVIATPGHTRDLLSYYIPERKILIGTEATGNQDRTGRIIMAPLTNYDSFVSSMKRLAALPAEILCTGHDTVWVGADAVRGYFARAVAATEAFSEKVEELLHEEHGSVERVVARIKTYEYDTNAETWQQEAAYLINLHAKVSVIAERLRVKKPIA